ncbi:MAG: PKD domain-containing protein [Bacteroidetes bacterium]|jgi:PKD repeat protein|nr:PKD domain-containing protein [Bacteroidota bacterium]MBT6685511.1 PKD domain-containing protein [Bacteroidota bacterium]MBT7144369.1 PKD domain-containing protein [Bacteroidota bacterium]MBT7491791.1 PKD domain-containing protein [Bacteroidota bacterium]
MKKQLLKIACLVVGILISTASFSQPNWYQPITSTNHTILLQSTIPMTIDGVQIESGDYIGVFYDSLGVLACGGFVEWAGTSSTIAAWGTDIGNDGFVNNEIFNFKIWDASTNLDLDATATFISTGFPNGNSFAVNGMSGLASLSATSPVVNPVAPEWDYSVTGTNHTILVPNTIPLTIDGLAIESGDFIGVFFDSLGTLKCGGYSEWNGQTNSVSAWGADIGLDGFAAGEEFVWKIWDASSNTELLASATYSVAFPNSGNFTVNGISGLESLVAATLPAPNWTYQITGSNHTILIQNTIPLTINGVQIESGDYLGVFYQANGALTCGGYAAWEGQTTNITAWGADVGNDGFAPSEEFIWKVFDASENMEFMAEAQYNLTGMFPNGGNFVVNGLSGLASLTAPFSIATDPGWTYSITATNHTILIPQTIITSIDGMAIDSGDYIGVFFDSLGILACAGYAEWTGQTAISAWGADIGNDGFATGETFKWVIWDATTGNEYLMQNISYDSNFANDSTFFVNGLSSLQALSAITKAVTAITSPVSGCDLSASELLTVEITNYNFQDATGFSVSYQIDANNTISETVYAVVPSGGSINYTFQQTADLSIIGSYAISAFTGFGSVITETVEHYPLPVVSFTGLALSYCENHSPVTLIGLPAGGTFNGVGIASNIFSPSVAGQGPHEIKYTYADANGCTNFETQIVIVNPLPIVDFSVDNMACLGEATILAISSIFPGQNASYSWDFGDGTFAVGESTTHIYALPGTYDVTLTATDIFGCTNSMTNQAIVNNLPMAYFMGNDVCIGDTTVFNDFSFSTNSNIVSWFWDFGDGNNSTLQNPLHVYLQDGTYSVTLTVTNSFGCLDIVTSSVIVFAEPFADFYGDTICFGNETHFTDLSFGASTGGTVSLTTWFWDFGDGTTSNLSNPVHTFSNAGIHAVSLTTTNSNGCSSSIVQDVLVFDLPTANFSAPAVCLDSANVYTDLSTPANGTIINWLWDFGNGNISNVQNPFYIYQNSGLFNVTLTVSDYHCINSITQSVEVYASPVADFTFTEVCVGEATVFTDLSDGSGSPLISWSWTFGVSNTSTLQNPSYEFSDAGTIPVFLLVVNQNNCSDYITQSVTVNELPDVSFTASTACLGDPTIVTTTAGTGSTNITDWLWDFDDGNISNLNNPQHTYANSGTYIISLTVTNSVGCSFSTMNIAEVLTLPQVDIGDNATIGNNQTLIIDAGAGFTSYLWNNGETGQSIDVGTTGTYSVAVTDLNGCMNVSNDKYIFVAPWVLPNTGINHTILIQNTIPLMIDTNNIDIGDLIGVFYDSLGTLACGGFLEWTGITTAVTAWGVDAGNDGFATGEEFNWKIYDVSEEAEYDAAALYNTTNFPNTGSFAVNGLSGITELIAHTSQIQDINLVVGWRIFSTYIEPFDPIISNVFVNIATDVEIVKNGLGMMYWPAYGINLIGNMAIGEGYQIKMNAAHVLSIEGMAAVPELTPVPIPAGWSIMGYLRQTQTLISDVLSSMVSDISIVKDGLGMMYWPAYGINLIGDMKPGEGYQIQLYNAVTFYFPANSANLNKAGYTDLTLPVKFTEVENTGSNMSLCIPISAWSSKTPVIGDEIGIFSEHGKLVGSSVFSGDNLAISIWGNDEYSNQIDGMIENEKFILKYWNGIDETNIQIVSWLEGNEYFEVNKISVVEKLAGSEFGIAEFQLLQNNPNPFSTTTNISFSVMEISDVEISVFNILGEKLDVLSFTNLNAGNHSFDFDASKLPAGTYFYKMEAGDFVKTKTMNIVK